MTDLLSIAKSGLDASRTALKTVGHNLSNVNTEGFSRQRVHQESTPPLPGPGGLQGTGAQIRHIRRVSDRHVVEKLSQRVSDHAYFETQSHKLNEIEMIFNDLETGGLHKSLSGFYNAFRNLALAPESDSMKTVIQNKALLTVQNFHQLRSDVHRMARGIDSKVTKDVDEINSLLRDIAEFNYEITKLEASGEQTGDLRDKRDLAMKSLSRFFSVESHTDGDGAYVVHAKGVGPLVSGRSVKKLVAQETGIEKSTAGYHSSVEIYFEGRPGIAISERFTGGDLSSNMDIRNKDLRGLADHLDKLAFEFASSVNDLHMRGVSLRDSQTGIPFFAPMDSLKDASKNIALGARVLDDAQNIVAGASPDSPGDNRVAIAISQLQEEKLMGDGAITIEESYLRMVSQLGHKTKKARVALEQSTGLLAQAQDLRDRISGVSIDEETAALIRYQQSYEASAKVIQAAEEMFQTVLGIKK